MLDSRIKVGSVIGSDPKWGRVTENVVLAIGKDTICVWSEFGSAWCKDSGWDYIRDLSLEEGLTHRAKCVRSVLSEVALAT